MRKFTKFILFCCLFFLVSTSVAADFTYDCIIKHVYDVNEVGELKTPVFGGQFKGDKFSVSRETGKIIGNTLTTALAKETRVVNYGSNEDSFKAIAEFKDQFQLIEIKEFKKGGEKPFVASSMGGAGIVTGICK